MPVGGKGPAGIPGLRGGEGGGGRHGPAAAGCLWGGCADGDRGGPPPAHRGEGHLPPNGRRPSTSPCVCSFPCGGCWIFSPPMGSPSPWPCPCTGGMETWPSPPCGPTPTFSRRNPSSPPSPPRTSWPGELGLEADDPLRLEAGLLYTLSHNLDNGHVFLPYAKLLTAAQRLLGTESSVLEDHLEGLTDRGTIVREEIAGQDACYLARLHYCETYVANALLEMEGGTALPPRGPGRAPGPNSAGTGSHLRPHAGGGGENRRPAAGDAPHRRAGHRKNHLSPGHSVSVRPFAAAHRPHGPPPAGRPSGFPKPAAPRPPPSTGSWSPGTTARRGDSPSPTTNGSLWTPTLSFWTRPPWWTLSSCRPLLAALPGGCRLVFGGGPPTSFPRWGRAICSRICSAPGGCPPSA